jgi:Xaa-Pro aminopeptidase
MDFGCIYDGYCSDMTRTIVVGTPSEKQAEVYNIVLGAQLAALAKIKAGVTGKQADGFSREIIENAGYGKYFTHALGHGVGMDIHERPRVSPKNENLLRSGMVVSVEPGIYIPNEFGVRIEDVVLVKSTGNENFTASRKELISCR